MPGPRRTVPLSVLALALTGAAAGVAFTSPGENTEPVLAVSASGVIDAATLYAPTTGDVAALTADIDAERAAVLAARSAALSAEATATETDEVRALRQESAERATRAAERARLDSATPKELGQVLAAERGWTGDQFSCLDSLWTRESKWDPTARNPSSGAFGIPQALPGSKMASAGADWATNPATQISWGLTYIADRYGTPCGAWAHSESYNWY